MSVAAVITADIVNSTRLSKADYRKLSKNLEAILQDHQHEFFRGDSLQVFLKDPAGALRLLLQMRTATIKMSSENINTDIRASIGIGYAKLPIKSLSTASGEAFTLSGRAFDKLAKDQRLTIVCDETQLAVNLGLQVISTFIDYIFRRLTVKQAAVVLELLMNRTQTETAKRLKKSQATVHKHTQSAGWPEIDKLLSNYKDLIKLIES
jgi:hypothetical protein